MCRYVCVCVCFYLFICFCIIFYSFFVRPTTVLCYSFFIILFIISFCAIIVARAVSQGAVP